MQTFRRARDLFAALCLGIGGGFAAEPASSPACPVWIPLEGVARWQSSGAETSKDPGCVLPALDPGEGFATRPGLTAGWLGGSPIWLGRLPATDFESASVEFELDSERGPGAEDPGRDRSLYWVRDHSARVGGAVVFGVAIRPESIRPRGGRMFLTLRRRGDVDHRTVLRLELPPRERRLAGQALPRELADSLHQVGEPRPSWAGEAGGPVYLAVDVEVPERPAGAGPGPTPRATDLSGLAEEVRVVPHPGRPAGGFLVLAKVTGRGWLRLEVAVPGGKTVTHEVYLPEGETRYHSPSGMHLSGQTPRDLWLSATRTEADGDAMAGPGPQDDGWTSFRVFFESERAVDPDQLALVVPGGEAYAEGRDAQQGGGAFGLRTHKLARRQGVWFYGRTREPGKDLEIWDMSRGVDGERLGIKIFPTKAVDPKQLAKPFARARFLNGERLAARHPRSGVLAARADTLRRAAGEGRDAGDDPRRRDRPEIDLFSIFSGALAIQESLQLDVDLDDPGPGPGGPATPLASLEGPKLAPIDFDALRQGREPRLAPMDASIPADLVYLRFRDYAAMRALVDTVDAWGGDLLQFVSPRGSDARVVETYEARLGLKSGLLGKLFGEQVIGEVGVVSFDPFFRDGTDLAVLLEPRNPAMFDLYKATVLGELEARGATRGSRTLPGGVTATVLERPDGTVRLHQARLGAYEVFAAGPRILDALSEGARHPEACMARDPGFRYTRVVQPSDAGEAAFVYLSDGFVRRIVGPGFKLAAARRARCAARLGALGHAARFDPSRAGARAARLRCDAGGSYSLAGVEAACSLHGSLGFLRPVSEVPVASVPAGEAETYREFARRYETYWRGFMDPIGIRLGLEPDLEVRTHVLPLIRSSIYAGMAQVAQVAAEAPALSPLKARVPDALLAFSLGERWLTARPRDRDRAEGADLVTQLQAELAGGATFYVHDGDPLFLLHGLEEIAGRELASGPQAMFALPISAALASIAMPVSLEVPIKDPTRARILLDEALGRASRWFQQGRGLFRTGTDGYKGGDAAAFAFDLGPLRFHILAAIEGDRLLVSTKPAVLERLREAVRTGRGLPAAVEGARDFRLEVYPGAAGAVAPSLGLAWGADMRRACFANLGDLTGLALADPGAGLPGPEAQAKALGQRPLCPQGGAYSFDPRGREAVCSVHGVPGRARQPGQAVGAGGVAGLRDLEAVSVGLELGAESLDSRLVLRRRK